MSEQPTVRKSVHDTIDDIADHPSEWTAPVDKSLLEQEEVAQQLGRVLAQTHGQRADRVQKAYEQLCQRADKLGVPLNREQIAQSILRMVPSPYWKEDDRLLQDAGEKFSTELIELLTNLEGTARRVAADVEGLREAQEKLLEEGYQEDVLEDLDRRLQRMGENIAHLRGRVQSSPERSESKRSAVPPL